VTTNQQFLLRTRVVEVLLIGVDCDCDSALNSNVRDTIHRVIARAAATAYENARIGWSKGLEFTIC
jgi:hypothetical protein